jgi:peptidoglycan/xylan/chitin deacetylase (PgdA/CDA1 family)
LSSGGASRPPAWGAEHRRAAVAVTFDNLGEASDLERRQWPPEEPLGRHFSVTRALPRVLGLLAELELRATFFVEGVNATLYPEALQEIDAAGHEVAYHGWRHEAWTDLDPTRERDLLRRGVEALAELGLRPVGFRPPGGRLAPSSTDALTDTGFAYCSPAGEGGGVRQQLVVLPFRWTLIDAFHYLPTFAERRRAALGSPDPLPPVALRATLGDALQQATSHGAFLATLFHPFLADADDRLEALCAVLTDIHTLAAEHAVWCAPLREIAAWMLQAPGASSWDLRLDED